MQNRFRIKRSFLVVALAMVGTFSGCDCGGGSANNTNNQNNANNQNNSNNVNNENNLNNLTDTGVDGGDDLGCEPLPYSGNVNFKKGRRFNTDLANALGLPEDQVCNELGSLSCADFVHRVALGDPEPYFAGVYEAPPNTNISTTLIVERMAMAGCIARVDQDIAAPDSAVIFAGLQSGTLDVADASVDQMIDTLYRRGLVRSPKPEEVAELKAFYDEVVAEAPADPAREWTVLACFAVMSSVESTFY